MTDIMNEIDDDLRKQQLAAFWKQNGAWIISGAVLAVLLTGAITFWRGHVATRDMNATQALLGAVQKGSAEDLEKIVADKPTVHSAFAGLLAAGMHARKGETEKAVALYDQIAATRGLDALYRDLATLLSVSQRLDTGAFDQLHAALKPLTADKNVWRYSASEMMALLFARENRLQDAAQVLEKITTDSKAPDDVRARALTLRALYQEGASNAAGAAGGR